MKNSYALDDDFVTAGNKQVSRGIKAIPEIFTTPYSEKENLRYEYRPIVKVTYALEAEIRGTDPHLSHLINLLLYAFTGMIMLSLLFRLLKDFPVWLPLTITLLFMAHPLHTEVVASLKNRDELLSFMFCLLSLKYAVLFYDNRKIKNLIAAILMYLLAFFSKQSALVFLAIIPLSLYFFTNIRLRNVLLVTGLMVICFFLIRFFQNRVLPESDRVISYWENPLFFEKGLSNKIPLGFSALLFYLKQLVFPYRLLFYYGYDMLPLVKWHHPKVLFSIVLHLALFVTAVIKLRKKHLISYGILFYLICISMFSNLWKPAMGIVAERYAYAASLGFTIAVGWLLYKLSGISVPAVPVSRYRFFSAVFLLFALLVLYSVRTIVRNNDWKDYNSLYSADIKFLEHSAKAHELYASEIMRQVNERLQKGSKVEEEQSKIQLALHHFEQCTKIYPGYFSAFNNIGLIHHVLLKDYPKAETAYRKAVAINPDYKRGYMNLALVQELNENFAGASHSYRQAIRIDSFDQLAYARLAAVLFRTGKTDSALIINNEIMKRFPENEAPYINLGNYALSLGDTLQAMNYWEQAITKNPANINILQVLYQYYKSKGRFDKANYYLSLIRKHSPLK